MAGQFTNANVKVSNEEIKLIMGQFDAIDEQKEALNKSKKHILKTFDITYANYRIRKKALLEKKANAGV